MQSGQNAVLFILIVINSIIVCCKENPHRKRRKAAEKNVSQDLEGDAFLMQPNPYNSTPPGHNKQASGSAPAYEPMRDRYGNHYQDSQETLVKGAAAMGNSGYRSLSQGRSDHSGSPPPSSREPRLPSLGYEQYRHR